jgi:hypothetical protein
MKKCLSYLQLTPPDWLPGFSITDPFTVALDFSHCSCPVRTARIGAFCEKHPVVNFLAARLIVIAFRTLLFQWKAI